jgi:hypothetical protein
VDRSRAAWNREKRFFCWKDRAWAGNVGGLPRKSMRKDATPISGWKSRSAAAKVRGWLETSVNCRESRPDAKKVGRIV